MLNDALSLGLSLLLATAPTATQGTKKSCCEGKQACPSKAAKGGNLRCSLTGTVVESCCCVQKEGKLYCTLAKKSVDSCCCQPVSKASGRSVEDSTREVSGSSLR